MEHQGENDHIKDLTKNKHRENSFNLSFLNFLVTAFWFFGLLFYLIGFMVWNSYLARFGYFEESILQTRYIATGTFLFISFFQYLLVNFISLIPLVIIIVIIIILSILLFVVYKFFRKRKLSKFITRSLQIWFLIIFCFSFYYFFNLFENVFLETPSYKGGGLPAAYYFFIDKNIVDDFAKINVDLDKSQKDEKGNINCNNLCQTELVCVLYNNDNYITFVPLDIINIPNEPTTAQGKRVVVLEKNKIVGFQPSFNQLSFRLSCKNILGNILLNY